MRIGIDLLGSDTPPADLLPAIRKLAEQAKAGLHLVVLTTRSMGPTPCVLTQFPHLEIRYVDEFISMADDPLFAIRKKKNSSLVLGMRMLKKKQIDAFVSAGNTGALVAAAALMLPMLPGIKRPALLAVLPTLQAPLTVLDVGGNVSCKAQHLVQFAQLGAAYHRCRYGKASTKIGLLNIGAESKKGTAELREAHTLLNDLYGAGKSEQVHFIGNVEARDTFRGTFDVLVTDGFTGNILLKTSEGVSSFVFDYLQEKGSEQLKGSLEGLQGIFNYDEHPGAIICGTEGLVIKCHGNATAASLYAGVRGAIDLLEKQFIARMKDALM